MVHDYLSEWYGTGQIGMAMRRVGLSVVSCFFSFFPFTICFILILFCSKKKTFFALLYGLVLAFSWGFPFDLLLRAFSILCFVGKVNEVEVLATNMLGGRDEGLCMKTVLMPWACNRWQIMKRTGKSCRSSNVTRIKAVSPPAVRRW
ncbi:hypothetical protein L873DRAFT_120251 [Choiromyces venosus 120613-1]|uniref:Uncharacterized protein n=1 Tax=Choiromyces venosus 120613-1 TaxID=1336337 RepID=A0A3N4J970_9PEZI|nr:hypothetical protein L873DRAFT_120251 [Choiromyces venosus 120613-1]